MNIIASNYIGLANALFSVGFTDISSINWIRQPYRLNGMWHAEIRL